jgi:hypothetical protein
LLSRLHGWLLRCSMDFEATRLDDLLATIYWVPSLLLGLDRFYMPCRRLGDTTGVPWRIFTIPSVPLHFCCRRCRLWAFQPNAGVSNNAPDLSQRNRPFNGTAFDRTLVYCLDEGLYAYQTVPLNPTAESHLESHSRVALLPTANAGQISGRLGAVGQTTTTFGFAT